MIRGNCLSNIRCEACPIERLEDPADRLRASDVVEWTLNSESVNLHISVGQLSLITESKARSLDSVDLTPVAVGAVAVVLSGNCKVE